MGKHELEERAVDSRPMRDERCGLPCSPVIQERHAQRLWKCIRLFWSFGGLQEGRTPTEKGKAAGPSPRTARSACLFLGHIFPWGSVRPSSRILPASLKLCCSDAFGQPSTPPSPPASSLDPTSFSLSADKMPPFAGTPPLLFTRTNSRLATQEFLTISVYGEGDTSPPWPPQPPRPRASVLPPLLSPSDAALPSSLSPTSPSPSSSPVNKKSGAHSRHLLQEQANLTQNPSRKREKEEDWSDPDKSLVSAIPCPAEKTNPGRGPINAQVLTYMFLIPSCFQTSLIDLLLVLSCTTLRKYNKTHKSKYFPGLRMSKRN